MARQLGEVIVSSAEASGVALTIALSGPLGAGKTEWVRGLADGLGVDAALVMSPTFVIATEYPGRRRLAHVDLYRLESEAELEAAGFLDLLRPGTVVAVEWADRLPGALPEDRIELALARSAAAAEREVAARGTGPIARRLVEAWEERLRPDGERAACP